LTHGPDIETEMSKPYHLTGDRRMMTLPVATRIVSGSGDDHVSLDYETRLIRRKRLTSDSGLEFLVDLPETMSLTSGLCFLLDNGRRIGIHALPEALLEVSGDIPRLAWHIGNRHAPCQIEHGRLLIRRDRVMRAMLERLGANVRDVTCPFNPEGGAYGHGRTFSHSHGTGHGHGPSMDDRDILKLAQWLSPAFPIGGFAYSHGLEEAIGARRVTDAESLRAWISAVIRRGSGRSDAVLLCAAMAPAADIGRLSDRAAALSSSAERWRETIEQGTAFVTAHGAVTGMELPPLPLPVAVGRAAANLSLSRVRVAALYLQNFTSNLVSAAVRFVPLGQYTGQKVLARMQDDILAVANEAPSLAPEAITSSVPGADLSAVLHETRTVRIFKT